MSRSKASVQLPKSLSEGLTLTHISSVPPSLEGSSSLGLLAWMVMDKARGTMKPGLELSQLRVKLSCGLTSDTILITVEERPITPLVKQNHAGPREWWSRLASATTSSTKNATQWFSRSWRL